MCTILGAAGDIKSLPSKSRQEFHELLSCLFSAGELRGRDASGFWAWRDDHYIFEKRPIPAQDLIYRSMGWKSLRFNPASLYIAHTRSTTDGDPNINMNNHPHIGEHSVMVHNGMVFAYEQIAKAYNLGMKTDCDSEVLLRLAESDEDMKNGLKNMMNVSRDATGLASVAVAFVDRRNPNEVLLTRNSGNPLHLYQIKRLNCTFFASTDEIMDKALEMLYGHHEFIPLGVERTVVDTYKLYRLKADGTWEKEDLVNFQQAHRNGPYQNYSGYGQMYGHHAARSDSTSTSKSVTSEQLQQQVGTILQPANVYGESFALDLTGVLTPLENTTSDEEQQEQYCEFEIMPDGVKEDLIGFLRSYNR